MSTALAVRLIASGAVSAADAEGALLSSLARRVPFVRALIDTGAIGEAVLEQTLEQLGGIGLRQVGGMPELVNRLPPHFCRRMGVLPVRVDPSARVVEVAAADPLDPHVAAEVGFHLGVPVRVLRAPISAIEEAIRRIELEAAAAAGRARRATPPFPHGAPESSNPPPPPPEPTPIPLLRRTGDRSPDTLRLYKQTLRPGHNRPENDLGDAPDSDAPPGSDPVPLAHPKTLAPPDLERPEPPRALRESSRLRDLAGQITTEPTPGVRDSTTQLRELGRRIKGEPAPSPKDTGPNLRDLAEQLQNEPIPRAHRDSGRLRDLAQQASREPSRGLRDSTPRLRDRVEAPPPVERLRDSTPRLRDLAAGLSGEGTTASPAADDNAPLSSMVAGEPPPPGEPPAVSFPSLPPPSELEQPGLLAADADWSAPAPPVEPRPEPPAKQRRPSRFARPAIDIQLPQPPSESRARRLRTIWDVPMAGGEVRDEAPPLPEAPPQPAEPIGDAPPSAAGLGQTVLRPDILDTSAVLDALRGAGSRDDAVSAALRGLRTVGRRAAIFVVRRDGFHGWACNVEMGDQEKLRRVSVPHDAPSLFATAVATGSYFGPVPGNAVHAGLIDMLEHSTTDVAVAVARAGGKPVMLLFADDLVDAKRRILPRLIELSEAVGAALSRLLAARL